ncbi:DUF3617 domain-containing protein [Caenimonas soli]|jgi:hypothetical protein|uniref:DUF3617 domain-containing protein n=1 Tax=Caenimonas soli TaxID=2735555 RepID=UPI001551A8A3|nr:DUF3617 domain-containing protein [Caenimonas soli]NPC58409.1 DUF3617 domain-containing protein [Caenimonas soli]
MKSNYLAAALLAAFASTAGAQSMKPGLWEVTQKMQSTGGQSEQGMPQMQEQMANMPPDQRKMVEEMMAKQGVKMGPAGGMTAKVCMTKEMVEKNELPSQQGDCKTTHQSRSGNTMKFATMCVNPPSAGEGQVTFTSPEAYTMKMVVTSKSHGKPEKMNMEGGGKWLGADCGNVKPIVPPAAKK